MSRILVIDDDAADLAAMGDDLRAQGHEPVLVEGGRTAIELIDGGAEFDLVVVDIVMPEMDGLELLRALRKRASKIPALAVTTPGRWANFNIGDVVTELGGKDTLMKPFPGGQFPRSVASLLRRAA